VRKEPDIPEKPVVIRADTDERHRLDEYSYREESRDGVTHVLGTIYGSVVWEREKSPYVMDENVFVAQDSSLTIEPGVIVKVVRLPRGPCNNFGGRITLNVLGTLVAEGRPDAMIWFTAASDVPAERDEWSGLRFRGGSSASILKWAVVEYAMGGVDAFGSPLIAHCIFKYCTHAVYLERDFVGDVRHNVIAYSSNPIACTGTRAEATIINNISYAGFGGIHAWGNAAPYADYNLYWSSKIKDEASRYYRGIVPGPHDLQLDPGFVDPPDGNFRLVRSSPARGAGLRHAEKRPRMIRWMPLTGPKESDMGLFIRGWSRDSAKRETDEWVSDGARSLWYAGLQVERKWPEEAQQYYEQALQRDVAPELRYKIVCSLGRVLVALGQYEQAREILEQVLSESRLPHMRDLARREIAEAFASEGRTEEALALLKGTEWPQSHVWVESANATYAVAGGDYQDSLAYLDRLKRNEPGLYVKAVSDLISDRLAARQVEAAAALSEGFDAYPLCNAAPAAHLDIAKACRKAERPELAVQLLRKSCERDPFSKEAPESLSLLAEILESDLGREEEAAAVRARLCRNYFPFNSYVMDAHSILAETGVSLARTPRNKMILLDGTFSEWSIFDRRAWGTNYCSQHDVIRILTKAGYVVHTNRRERRYSRNAAELTPALLERYGLVVCNGRFRGRADPPMPSEVIETLVNYVQEGGSLLIVAGGKNLWEGGLAEFYNPLTQQFGLGFVEGADLEHGDGATTNHPAVRDLEKFVHVTGCPVRVEGGDVLGYAGDEPIIAVAQHGNGRVVAAGIGIGFAGGILGPTRHNADGMHPENEKLLVALASYLLSEVPERPVTTRQRTQRPRAQRERVPQKRGVEQIIPEPQRDFPQARQQSPDGRDSNSAAPLSIIPGEPVSEEEAREIVERLRSRLYLPRENLESLKCEFEPRFVDTTKYAQRWAEEMGEEPPIPKGAKVGHFEGTFIPSFLFLRDNGLSRAKKAVLYWEKVDANLPIERNVATVLLYDEQGNRINAHPAIGPALGSICLHHMHIHGHVPFWMVEPDERFQTHWRLDAPSDGPKTLYMVYNAVGQDAWNMAKVVFEDGDEALPLSAGTGRWHRRLQRWSPSESVEYGRLGKSGKVAIVRSGTDPYVLKYTWTNIGGAWVVSRVQGTTPDLEDFDMRKWVPWERTFTNFEINPQIPEGLLDWPSTPALKMDFSTPDAAIETIMNCLRAGREDLLPHCSVEPPDDPVPTEAMPNMMAYWFEEFDHMRDGLRVLEKRQEDEHWIYKVQIPQPTSGHRRSFDIKLVPVGDNWKMDVDIGLLLFQFWD
jgi:tetratricopeptide (TPR) repeat protein